jgi:hypothetical protein
MDCGPHERHVDQVARDRLDRDRLRLAARARYTRASSPAGDSPSPTSACRGKSPSAHPRRLRHQLHQLDDYALLDVVLALRIEDRPGDAEPFLVHLVVQAAERDVGEALQPPERRLLARQERVIVSRTLDRTADRPLGRLQWRWTGRPQRRRRCANGAGPAKGGCTGARCGAAGIGLRPASESGCIAMLSQLPLLLLALRLHLPGIRRRSSPQEAGCLIDDHPARLDLVHQVSMTAHILRCAS